MNLIESHIVEIHSEQPTASEWFDDGYYIEVDVTYNCYGTITRGKHSFNKDEWEVVKQNGYWLS